jgi:hypothetical protein
VYADRLYTPDLAETSSPSLKVNVAWDWEPTAYDLEMKEMEFLRLLPPPDPPTPFVSAFLSIHMRWS